MTTESNDSPRRTLCLFLALGLGSIGSLASAQVCITPPSEARELRLSGSGTTTLNWQAPLDPGGTQTVIYDVVRSTTPNGFGSGYCVASGVQVLSGTDPAVAAPTLFYLVRAKNGCGGNLGTDSSGTPTTGVGCLFANGGACLYSNECIGGGCCNGYCRDLMADPDYCGDCENACSTTNVGTRECVGGVCVIGCASGFANCDSDDANGCECVGSICCGGNCAPPHVNGLGQSFDSCLPPGVPGSEATYSLSLATAARAAWPFVGTDSAAGCSGGALAIFRQTATSCAVWVYSKTLAGRVRLNSANSSCFCPTLTDPTWQ